MPRKTRYWLCPRCAALYHRTKHGKRFGCGVCGKTLIPIRTYNGKRIDAIRARRAKQIARTTRERKVLTTRHSRPLTAFGYRLRFAKGTKKAWKAVERAKRRDSFVRRGQKFLDEMLNDIWTCPHQRGLGRVCGCKGGGWTTTPTLSVKSLGYGTMGNYQRGLVVGHNIHMSPDYPLAGWPATFIHEVTHWSDGASTTRDGGSLSFASVVGSHTPAFEMRMAYIAKALGFRGSLDDTAGETA